MFVKVVRDVGKEATPVTSWFQCTSAHFRIPRATHAVSSGHPAATEIADETMEATITLEPSGKVISFPWDSALQIPGTQVYFLNDDGQTVDKLG